jgi:hypothetical protein
MMVIAEKSLLAYLYNTITLSDFSSEQFGLISDCLREQLHDGVTAQKQLHADQQTINIELKSESPQATFAAPRDQVRALGFFCDLTPPTSSYSP